MLLSLDHLVVAVIDPDAAAGELERAVGLRCTGGGRHPLWGTWNRLAWLGDTYVELIGVFDRSLTPNGPVSRIVSEAIDRGHVGLVSYAVASNALERDLARLRARGSRLADVEARSPTWPSSRSTRAALVVARSTPSAFAGECWPRARPFPGSRRARGRDRRARPRLR